MFKLTIQPLPSSAYVQSQMRVGSDEVDDISSDLRPNHIQDLLKPAAAISASVNATNREITSPTDPSTPSISPLDIVDVRLLSERRTPRHLPDGTKSERERQKAEPPVAHTDTSSLMI